MVESRKGPEGIKGGSRVVYDDPDSQWDLGSPEWVLVRGQSSLTGSTSRHLPPWGPDGEDWGLWSGHSQVPLEWLAPVWAALRLHPVDGKWTQQLQQDFIVFVGSWTSPPTVPHPGPGGDPPAGQEPLQLPVRRLRLWHRPVRAYVGSPSVLQHQQPRPGPGSGWFLVVLGGLRWF